MKKTLLKAGVIGLLVSGWVSSNLVLGQSDPSGKKRITDTYAITNATVFTAPGKAGTKATLLIQDGIILGIGTNLSLPKEARLIAGDSLFIYPGFIDGASDAGITKPKDLERPEGFVSSNPSDEIAGITPWRTAKDQFSISGDKVDDLRKVGFTLIQSVPDGGMLAGKTSIIVLGSPSSTNLLKENAALAANFRGSRGMYPGTPAGVMAKFRDVYENSELTQQRGQQYASVAGVKRPEITPTYSAMSDVINGQTPVLFTAPTELEIRRAINLQKELGFNLILTGLEDYEGVIDVIKASNAKVLIKLETPSDKSIKAQKEEATEATKAQYARVKDAYLKAIAQVGKLEKAGIPFAFTTVGTKPADLMKSLKVMIENGLSEQGAMAALTTHPATILGISRFAGTIEKGKMANLILTTDSLFKEDSQVKHVVVDGFVYDYELATKKKAESNVDKKDSLKLDGNWDYKTETPQGSSGGILAIAKEGDTYTGTITYDDPSGSGQTSAPIRDVAVDGNKLTFFFDVTASGMTIAVEITGEISGASMDGTMSIAQFGSFPFEATLTPSNITNN
jgi:imidazolonepropionase-like amidohydrolase